VLPEAIAVSAPRHAYGTVGHMRWIDRMNLGQRVVAFLTRRDELIRRPCGLGRGLQAEETLEEPDDDPECGKAALQGS
jgi:hypothetical protein